MLTHHIVGRTGSFLSSDLVGDRDARQPQARAQTSTLPQLR